MVVLVDMHGHILWANHRFAEEVGCLERCSGKSLRKLIRHELKGIRLEQILATQQPVSFPLGVTPVRYRPRIISEHDRQRLIAFTAQNDDSNSTYPQQEPVLFRSKQCRMRLAQLEHEVATWKNAYAELADNLPMVVVRYNLKRERIFVNRTHGEFHGVTREQALRKRAIDNPICDIEHMIDVERCVQQVIDERVPCSVKRDYVDRRNRYICSTETFLPEFDAKHRLSGVLLIATGRYEEVEAMKRRLEEEEKFYDIFNNVGIPIAVSEKTGDGDYRFNLVNQAFEKLFGKPRFYFESKSVTERLDSRLGSKLTPLRDLAASGRTPQRRLVTVDINGATKTLNAAFYPSGASTKHGVKIIEVFRDLTEDYSNRNKLASFLRAFPDLAFSLSGGGHITFVTPSVLATFGGTTQDYLGKNIDHVFSNLSDDENGLLPGIRKLIGKTAEPFELATPLNTLSGARRYQFELIECCHAEGNAKEFILVGRDITKLRRIEKELRAKNAQLHELSMIKEQSVEEERKRIAYELHDELGQKLTAMLLTSNNISTKIAAHNREAHRQLRELREIVGSALHSVRRIVQDLRPPTLDLGLIPAVEWLVSNLANKADIDCDLSVFPEKISVEDNQSLYIFRCIQEALTNVIRHAKATLAYVEIRGADDEITVKIGDNGIGFDAHAVRLRSGLSGMKHRARALGGSLQISSKIGQGSELFFRFKRT